MASGHIQAFRMVGKVISITVAMDPAIITAGRIVSLPLHMEILAQAEVTGQVTQRVSQLIVLSGGSLFGRFWSVCLCPGAPKVIRCQLKSLPLLTKKKKIDTVGYRREGMIGTDRSRFRSGGERPPQVRSFSSDRMIGLEYPNLAIRSVLSFAAWIDWQPHSQDDRCGGSIAAPQSR